MFLAERAIFLGTASLRDSFNKGDHLPFGCVTRFGGILGPFSNIIGQIGFLDAFNKFDKFPDTLRYQSSTELVLVLPVPRNHPEDVAGYATSKGPTTLVEFAAFEQ
jgi:hypothetical protein